MVFSHVKCLQHHAVEVGTLTSGIADTDSDDATEKYGDQTYYDNAHQHVWCPWGSIVVLTLRMKPTVIDGLYVTCLFESGVFVVNHTDDVVVIADNTQFASWQVSFIKGNAIEA